MFECACKKLTLDRVVMAALNQEVAGEDMAGKAGLAGKKGSPAAAVDGALDDGGAVGFDRREVETMLREGAYGVFRSSEAESDRAAVQFAAEDIGAILKRSQVVRYAEDPKEEGAIVGVEIKAEGSTAGGETTEGASSDAATAVAAAALPSSSPPPPPSQKPVGGSSFSKASFVPLEGGEALSLDDPDFWLKIGMADKSDPEPAASAVYGSGVGQVLDTKRVRKAAAVWNEAGGEGDEEEMGGSSDEEGGAEKKKQQADNAANDGTATPGERQKSSGPARCSECLELTSNDDSTLLLCAQCDEETHLHCLGLSSVPKEAKWICPHCVRLNAKRKPAASDGDEDEEDGEYKPVDWGSSKKGANAQMAGGAMGLRGKQQAALAAGTEGIPPLPTRPHSPLLLPPRAGAAAPTNFSSSSSSDDKPPLDLRGQYLRLLGTYRITHPGKSEAYYTELASKMWKECFAAEPPDTSEPPLPQPTKPKTAAEPGSKTAAAANTSSRQNGGQQKLVSVRRPVTQRYAVPAPTPLQSLSPLHPLSASAAAQLPCISIPPQQHHLSREVAASATPSPVKRDESRIRASGFKCSASACDRMDDTGGSAAFSLCAHCRHTRYCSRTCQAAHWKEAHRQECKLLVK